MVFDAATMNFEPGWYLDPVRCNCDLEFIEWIENKAWLATHILHMGTGMHHRVGLSLSTQRVVGVTYSPAEMKAYMDLVKADPYLPSSYIVLFGDISTIHLYSFNKFDYVTLFHLGEITPKVSNPKWMDEFLQDLIQNNLYDNARILGYSKSAAFPEVQPLFEKYLEVDSEYKSLVVYKTKGG